MQNLNYQKKFKKGPLPANSLQKLRNSGVFQANDTFLVPKYKETSPKIHWRRFKVDWMKIMRRNKKWVYGEKIDEKKSFSVWIFFNS